MKKAVFYTRWWDDEQPRLGKLDISQQLHELELYCKQKNIHILQHFCDVHPGTDFDRPNYAKMMTYLEKNKDEVNQLLFTTRERFSYMNPAASNEMVGRLMAMEIEPRSLIDPYFLECNTPEEMQDFFDYYKTKYP